MFPNNDDSLPTGRLLSFHTRLDFTLTIQCLLHAIHGGFQVFHRIGVRDAQSPGEMKSLAGDGGDQCFFQQILAKIHSGFDPGASKGLSQKRLDVGITVKGALRLGAEDTFHGVQSGMNIIPALFEGGNHGRNIVLGAFQRRKSGLLGNGVGAGGGLALDCDDALGDIASCGGITDAPAGHGIGLGKAVDGDGSIPDFGGDGSDAEVSGLIVDQLFIDLIRDDEKVVFLCQSGQMAQAFLTVNCAGGIVGRTDHNGLCAGGDGLLDGLQIQRIVILPDGDEHRGSA